MIQFSTGLKPPTSSEFIKHMDEFWNQQDFGADFSAPPCLVSKAPRLPWSASCDWTLPQELLYYSRETGAGGCEVDRDDSWKVQRWYCWWKKSCTICYLWKLMNNGLFSIPTGAGFLPSTVGGGWHILRKSCNVPMWYQCVSVCLYSFDLIFVVDLHSTTTLPQVCL